MLLRRHTQGEYRLKTMQPTPPQLFLTINCLLKALVNYQPKKHAASRSDASLNKNRHFPFRIRTTMNRKYFTAFNIHPVYYKNIKRNFWIIRHFTGIIRKELLVAAQIFLSNIFYEINGIFQINKSIVAEFLVSKVFFHQLVTCCSDRYWNCSL